MILRTIEIPLERIKGSRLYFGFGDRALYFEGVAKNLLASDHRPFSFKEGFAGFSVRDRPLSTGEPGPCLFGDAAIIPESEIPIGYTKLPWRFRSYLAQSYLFTKSTIQVAFAGEPVCGWGKKTSFFLLVPTEALVATKPEHSHGNYVRSYAYNGDSGKLDTFIANYSTRVPVLHTADGVGFIGKGFDKVDWKLAGYFQFGKEILKQLPDLDGVPLPDNDPKVLRVAYGIERCWGEPFHYCIIDKKVHVGTLRVAKPAFAKKWRPWMAKLNPGTRLTFQDLAKEYGFPLADYDRWATQKTFKIDYPKQLVCISGVEAVPKPIAKAPRVWEGLGIFAATPAAIESEALDARKAGARYHFAKPLVAHRGYVWDRKRNEFTDTGHNYYLLSELRTLQKKPQFREALLVREESLRARYGDLPESWNEHSDEEIANHFAIRKLVDNGDLMELDAIVPPPLYRRNNLGRVFRSWLKNHVPESVKADPVGRLLYANPRWEWTEVQNHPKFSSLVIESTEVYGEELPLVILAFGQIPQCADILARHLTDKGTVGHSELAQILG